MNNEYKKQTHVGLFVVSTVKFETPILFNGEFLKTCETMIFRADSSGGVSNYQDLYSEKHDWNADLDEQHERIVETVRSGLMALPAATQPDNE